MKRLYESDAYQPGLLPANFWDTTENTDLAQITPLTDEVTIDVGIIGAGITGLNAGVELVRKGLSVSILDASHSGWGASGRNGGFVCMGGSKNSWHSLVKKHGLDAAKQFYHTQIQSIKSVEENLDSLSLKVDKHSNGEWEMAHDSYAMKHLIADAKFMQHSFGLKSTIYSTSALKEIGLSSSAFHGAVQNPHGFAINPRKYVNGLRNHYLNTGGMLFGNSEVNTIERQDNCYLLRTAQGVARCKKLIVATNGYTADNWINGLSGRYLPTVSNILVSRKLSSQELQQQGWTAHEMCYDSRRLLHYFRLMPNGHFLFGLRGSTSLSESSVKQSHVRARHDFERMFPAWAHIETPWFWSGLVCLSRTMNMYVGAIPDWNNAWTGMAYHGSGVAMGTWTGKKLAQLAVGEKTKIPKIMTTLKKFPLHPLRKNFIKAAYSWYETQELFQSIRQKLF